MKTFLSLFGALSLLFFALAGSFTLVLHLYGDQWLQQAIEEEAIQRFNIRPKIEETKLFIQQPGIRLSKIEFSIEKPPLKIRLEKFQFQIQFSPLALFTEDSLIDLHLEFEDPQFQFGFETND